VALAGLAASLFVVHPAHGQEITVPNGSFESPVAGAPNSGAVTTLLDSWTKTAQPTYFQNGGFFSWDQTSGQFANTAVGSYNNILNMDGNQAAFLLNFPGDGATSPGAGFYQELGATYTVGEAYTAYMATISETDVGDTVLLTLYYRDALNTIVPIATDTVTSAGEGDIQDFVTSTVSIPVVQSTDAWAGKNIGLMVNIGVGQADGGDWDVDKVALVPEPASAGLLVVGLGMVLNRRRRTAN
jgi:hypothetical protein